VIEIENKTNARGWSQHLEAKYCRSRHFFDGQSVGLIVTVSDGFIDLGMRYEELI